MRPSSFVIYISAFGCQATTCFDRKFLSFSDGQRRFVLVSRGLCHCTNEPAQCDGSTPRCRKYVQRRRWQLPYAAYRWGVFVGGNVSLEVLYFS